MKINPYLVLEVSPSATRQEIMLAFTQAVKRRRHSISEINMARAALLNTTDRLFADLLRPVPSTPHRYRNIKLSDVLAKPVEDTDSIIKSIPIYPAFFEGLIRSSLDSKIVEFQNKGKQLFEAYQARIKSVEEEKNQLQNKSNLRTAANLQKSLYIVKCGALIMPLLIGLGYMINRFVPSVSSSKKVEISLPKRPENTIIPKVKNDKDLSISDNQSEVLGFKETCGPGGPWIVVGPATSNLRATLHDKICGDTFVNSSGQLQVARMKNRADADKLAEVLSNQLKETFYVTSKESDELTFKPTCGPGGPWVVVGPADDDLRNIIREKYCGDAFMNANDLLQVARMAERSEADQLAQKLSLILNKTFEVVSMN